MPHALDSVLGDFKSDVERVENLLTLTKTFRDFGASSAPTTEGSEAAWREAQSLHVESKARRTDLPILSGSLLLYLAGRFEFCVRQIVQAVADDIASKTDKYQNLPAQIQKSLKQKTLEIAQNPKKYGHDEITSEALLDQLVINIKNNNQSVTINSTVLSITESNMRPSVLADLLKTVGMADFWKEIGKQANVKFFLDKGSDHETSAEAQAILNNIMEERNQIAHPTSTTTFPDADQVLKFAEFLKTLSANAVDIAKVYLSNYARERNGSGTD